MLLRFGVANFRSVWNYQEISLVATALKDKGPDLLQPDAIREQVLPVAAIYGANASGKTTILKALERLQRIVNFSHSKGGPDTEFPRSKFALSETASVTPTKFDADFIIDGVRYHYGFAILDSAVAGEWLYAFNGPYRNVWFERNGSKPIEFGRALKGRNRSIADLTRTNSLFVSAAAQNAHDQLTPIFRYLTSALVFRINNASEPGTHRMTEGGPLDPRAVAFLKYADTGIVEAKVEEEPQLEEARKLLFGLKKVLDESFDSESDVKFEVPDTMKRLVLGHSMEDGGIAYLSPSQESRGTIKLLALISDVYKCLDSGSVLVVDELDNSLHTVLARQVVSLFNSRRCNPSGGQLIFSTHDTNLMRGELFRRDQIWLSEKNQIGQTCIYPLSDIRVRGTDNFERGYLQGRFGAIPFLGGEFICPEEELESVSQA